MFFRRGKPTQPPPSADVFFSHALIEMHRRRSDRPIVLDLGPALQANYQFWAESGGVVHVGDLYGGLIRGEFPPHLEFDEPLDVVLAWDLFEYLEAEQMRQLIDWLEPGVRKGGVMHALLSSRSEIPSRPSRFEIHDREHICQERTTESRRCSTAVDFKLLSEFELLHSYLLKHGWQEHLLVRRNKASSEAFS